jgi:ACT domain-containing protein
MSEHVIDTVLRVRVEHRPGQLARLASTIADVAAIVAETARTIGLAGTARL